MRLVAILFGIPLLAFGQIQDLATTADGGQTYFSTAYRDKGSAEASYLKLFRVAEHGLELFRQLTLAPLGVDTTFNLAELPSVSADGRTVAYLAARSCNGGSHCVGFIYHQAWLAGASDRNLGTGVATVSPDGQWYLVSNAGNFGFPNTATIGNFNQGTPVTLSGYTAIGDGKQGLANGPIALLTSLNGPALWKAGTFTPLTFKGTPIQARVDWAGDMIVYELAPANGNFELHSYSVASGTDVLLATGGSVSSATNYYSNSYFFHSSLTFDGKYVSYLLDNRLYIQPTGGTSARALTAAADGNIVDAVVAAWGNVAFAATDFGRLLRIDVATGTETELIAVVPHLDVTNQTAVPGGRIDVTGPAEGDPALLGANATAPVVGRSGSTVTLQVPWEATAGSTVQLVAPMNPSAFEEVHELTLQTGAPLFYTLPSTDNSSLGIALAAHQDFSGLVTTGSPAKPGEVLHLYFTGLGVVAPAIATGAVTPSSPLYRLQTPLSCTFELAGNVLTADILFAGLAPGTIGIEQVDMRVPAQLGTGTAFLDCQSQGPVGKIWGYAQLPVAQ